MDIMIKLCAQFTANPDLYCMKINQVMAESFLEAKLVNYKNLGKVNPRFAVKDSSTEEEEKKGSEISLLTKMFFCTHHILGFEFKRIMNMHEEIIRRMSENKEDTMYKKLLMGLDAHILHPEFMDGLLKFITFSCTFLLVQAYPEQIDRESSIKQFMQKLYLPLPNDTAFKFAIIPEYIIESINRVCWFYRINFSLFFKQLQVQVIFHFYITMLHSNSISNPHIKSQLIKFLSAVAPLPRPDSKIPTFSKDERNRFIVLVSLFNYYLGVFEGLLHIDFAKDYILESMIKGYVECEKTGTHNQFYEKFSYRQEILNLLQYSWRSSQKTNIIYIFF
jgi:hypothetical protein